jgi:hypothetical protein
LRGFESLRAIVHAPVDKLLLPIRGGHGLPQGERAEALQLGAQLEGLVALGSPLAQVG